MKKFPPVRWTHAFVIFGVLWLLLWGVTGLVF